MRINVNKLISSTLGALALFMTITSGEAQAQQVPGRATSATLGTVSSTAPALKLTRTAAPIQTQAEWILNNDTELVRVPLNKIVSVKLPGKVRNVIIGNPAIANIVGPNDGTRAHVYVLALLVGSTSIIFEDAQGNILYKGDIQVDIDVVGIQSAISELLPDEKIQVTAQRNSVFLKGFVRSAVVSAQAFDIVGRFVADANSVINNLEVLGSRQVIMQVHVSEMKRNVIKQLGFDFTYSKNIGTGTSRALSLTQDASTPLAAARTAAGLTAAFATGNILPAITGFGNISYQVLEENGLAKTLAEPVLTAISGETATFLAGGTFPMLTTIDTDGNKTYTQTPFGIRLSFTPTVMDKGQINLHIATEVSDRDTSIAVDGIPGLKINRTETVVDLPSGGSLIISGLIQNELINTVDGVPGLKDMPIIGALFRSEAYRNKETELVVTITAYLAEPVGNNARLALPSDGFVASSDMDLYLLGRLHKEYTKLPLPPYATPLAGPYGYIME
ncbi:MAG: hypothetical protein COB59_05115 [Rhodospirillaceae bacterium]|nr:MAG: hypothetical protein COB59_05115 [Rhodospirillaceae bacterium]